MTNGILINQTIELTGENILEQLQSMSETPEFKALFTTIEFSSDTKYEDVDVTEG